MIKILKGRRRIPHKLETAYIYMIDNLKQQLADKDEEIEALKYKIEILQFGLDIIAMDKLNPLSPYKWYDLVKEMSKDKKE